MMASITHEFMVMPQTSIPIKIFKRESNKTSVGCEVHWHEQLEFYYVVSGGIHLLCNGMKEWIYAGDIAFVNWCEPHKSINFLDNTIHYIIQVDISAISNNETMKNYLNILTTNIQKFPMVMKDNKLLINYFKTIIQEYFDRKFGFELAITANIINILAYLMRMYDNSETTNIKQSNALTLQYINKIILYISENYTKDIRLTVLANYLGITIQYMCKIFKNHTGTTITKYINQIKCTRATSLIMNGSSITEAAASVGFSDYNYFSRLYKNTVGVSPSVFRHNHH